MNAYRTPAGLALALTLALIPWLPLVTTRADPTSRDIPTPGPEHPGNIFCSGEPVTLAVPQSATPCRLFEYDGRMLAEIRPEAGRAALGTLPVGYYRLEMPGASNSISLGVISKLKAPTPASSPIGIDVAMSWFYDEKKMSAVANLCALAGVNWVRDRLNWAEMEPVQGQFASSNRYDASAWAQSQAGLQVLQVIHRSPAWANPETKRFPIDLRDAYRFYQSMARRWQGEVKAFEPWNEADIPMFGGHTGSEMASLQKAAYLGLKAGNPAIIACLNVFALPNHAQLEDLHANEAWAYFDTFNLHHYAPFDEYPKLYADFRAVSAGRPLWVSECSLPVKWSGNPALKELSDADLKTQSERVARTFASSLHEGSTATFYFMLPHYVEGPTQFGILHPDLTPRPAYVALAAVGRILAEAEPLGRLKTPDPSIRGFLFRARPDGVAREVLVAWTTKTNGSLHLPLQPVEVFDHLGRTQRGEMVEKLSTAPVFVLLPVGTEKALSLTLPPSRPAALGGNACPIVLQAVWPEDKRDLKLSAYRLSTETSETIPVYAYNLGSRSVRGAFRIDSPTGWKASLSSASGSEAQIEPQGRIELPLTVSVGDAGSKSPGVIRITGDFGPNNQPVLSLRLEGAAKPDR